MKDKYFLWAVILYIMFLAFPLFVDITNIPIELVSAAVVVVILCCYLSNCFSRTSKWLFLYILILTLYIIAGKYIKVNGCDDDLNPWRKLLIESAWIMPSILIFSVCFTSYNRELINRIGKISIILLLVSFLYIVPLIVLNPISLRGTADPGDNVASSIIGFPNYTLLHAYVFFLPALCYGCHASSKKNKTVMLVLTALVAYVVFRSEITTSLICLIGIILFTLVYDANNQNKSIFVFAIISILIYTVYKSGLLISVIDFLMSLYSDTAVESKLVEFRQSLLQGEVAGSQIELRQNLHDISFNAFLNNPILGCDKTGGHSLILDKLGSAGLVGFIPFIMIIITLVSSSMSLFNTRQARAYYLLGVAVVIVFMYQKGIFGCEGWLFMSVILPFSICYLESIFEGNPVERIK